MMTTITKEYRITTKNIPFLASMFVRLKKKRLNQRMRKNTSKHIHLPFLETRSQQADLCTLLRQAGPFGRQAVQSRLAISLGGTLKDIAMDVVILTS